MLPELIHHIFLISGNIANGNAVTTTLWLKLVLGWGFYETDICGSVWLLP